MKRPRDRLGRPLPVGSPDAFPEVTEREFVDGATAWSEASAYLDEGLVFHAHEVFEQRWRCAPQDERLAWQALAQWAAALTHEARGNGIGAAQVAKRALRNLNDASIPDAVDDARVRTSLAQLLAD
jgi:uncharacterized protein